MPLFIPFSRTSKGKGHSKLGVAVSTIIIFIWLIFIIIGETIHEEQYSQKIQDRFNLKQGLVDESPLPTIIINQTEMLPSIEDYTTEGEQTSLSINMVSTYLSVE